MTANLENSAVATGMEEVSFHSNPKERQCQRCSNYHTVALISHASKLMLKILQVRLQQYMNRELPFQMFKLVLEKAEEPEIILPHLLDHWKSKRIPEKHLLLLHWLCQCLWLCGSQQTGKFYKRWEFQTAWPASLEICMQVKKQQLELDMDNRLVPNWESSTSRLCIVTLLI